MREDISRELEEMRRRNEHLQTELGRSGAALENIKKENKKLKRDLKKLEAKYDTAKNLAAQYIPQDPNAQPIPNGQTEPLPSNPETGFRFNSMSLVPKEIDEDYDEGLDLGPALRAGTLEQISNGHEQAVNVLADNLNERFNLGGRA